MRYLGPVIALLCFLWYTIGALLEGRGLRNWQTKAEVLEGLSGMSFCGLVIYRWSSRMSILKFAGLEGFLVGITLGIFVTLWLEGSANILKKYWKRGQPGAGG
jgi:hypothetical protein